MFPLPVLMLMLATALADAEPHFKQVCFNISKGNINAIINETNNFIDLWNDTTTCYNYGTLYILICKRNQTLNFEDNICLKANVIQPRSPKQIPVKTEYHIEKYGICTEHLCENISVIPLIDTRGDSIDKMTEMTQLLRIRNTCAELFRTDNGVKRVYMKAEKRAIHNIMATTLLENEQKKTYNMDAFSLKVINISDVDLDSEHKTIKIEAPQLPPPNVYVPDVWLPVDELRKIPKEKRIFCLVSYMDHSHFDFQQVVFSSMILRIELLGDRHLRNLATPIKMIFRDKLEHVDESHLENRVRQCCYLDEEDFTWKSDGCETYNNTQFDTICKCSHTTPFAVLLIRQPIDNVHWEILSYLSYIGCGLSAFFMSLSLIIYVFGRSHKLDYSISIHVSLSGALFLLNTTFLMTEWGATVKPDWVCVFVAAVMHYSLLCSFTWMAIEALHLYLLLIKVFNTYYKHYMVKLSLAGWGIPGLIVGVSLAIKDYKQFYGITQMTMADTNQTNAICWITDESFFYSLNLVYFIMIFIFNSSILVAVASSICKMKQATWSKSKHRADTWGDPKKFSESCKSGLTVLCLTCLMGTTWGLAFLGSGYINYPILYLFCILNSAQGFFVFLWICLSTNKQRKRDMEERMTSSGMRTVEYSEDKTD